MDARFLTAGPPEVLDSAPAMEARVEAQADRVRDGPCIRRAARRPAPPRDRVPASDNVRGWAHGLALDSVPARAEPPALCRLQAKHRARSVPGRARAAAARPTRRPRKAR